MLVAIPAAKLLIQLLFIQGYGIFRDELYYLAGAVDYFGSELGLPPAISGHNNYWLWRPDDWDGQVLIVKGGSVETLSRYYKDVEQVATFYCELSMPYEDNAPIFVCRDPLMTVEEAWERLKSYN